mmetsp:Transcript_12606/g.26822  ORF Transcript_12606/g.26822 Transcript_12606/m.26822 type:complete len:211 (-) Transcript_12606:141-773(-)
MRGAADSVCLCCLFLFGSPVSHRGCLTRLVVLLVLSPLKKKHLRRWPGCIFRRETSPHPHPRPSCPRSHHAVVPSYPLSPLLYRRSPPIFCSLYWLAGAFQVFPFRPLLFFAVLTPLVAPCLCAVASVRAHRRPRRHCWLHASRLPYPDWGPPACSCLVFARSSAHLTPRRCRAYAGWSHVRLPPVTLRSPSDPSLCRHVLSPTIARRHL